MEEGEVVISGRDEAFRGEREKGALKRHRPFCRTENTEETNRPLTRKGIPAELWVEWWSRTVRCSVIRVP